MPVRIGLSPSNIAFAMRSCPALVKFTMSRVCRYSRRPFRGAASRRQISRGKTQGKRGDACRNRSTYPDRFDTDSLPVQATPDLRIVNNIDLVEVIEYAGIDQFWRV